MMTCECRENPETGELCTEGANWFVRIGYRASDGQFSCHRCLGAVVSAMYEAERRVSAIVTIMHATRAMHVERGKT